MKSSETKRERFIRIAEARTNKIISMIKLLGNCSNASVYEFSNEDIEKIFGAIDTEIKEARKKFNSTVRKDTSSFKL